MPTVPGAAAEWSPCQGSIVMALSHAKSGDRVNTNNASVTSGEVDLICHGKTHTLQPGDLIYLNDAEPHALHCKQQAILLVTLILHRK